MRVRILQLFIILFFITHCNLLLSQEVISKDRSARAVIDSLTAKGIISDADKQKPEIILSRYQAIEFLQRSYQPHLWKSSRDPLRQALGQLIYEASHPTFDTAIHFLYKYPFDSISIPFDQFYIWEPLRLKIPSVNTSLSNLPVDSINKPDTNRISGIKDSLNLNRVRQGSYSETVSQLKVLKDTTIMIVVDTLNEVTSTYPGFPFRYYRFPYQGDSIIAAVNLLIGYLEGRDSSIIDITGIGDKKTPIWLNSKSERMIRYWLKNDLNDSVAVWIGSPSRNTIGLYLENGVSFRRPAMQGNYSGARINVQSLDKTKLLGIQKIMTKSQFWKYRTEASFVLNQGMVTNWVKGGESNISTALDITEYADYDNKPLLLSSNHFARLKFGLIRTGENGIRKNIDLLETNSKLNHKAFGKFDFSAIMLFKTQIARGYNYPDTIPVSKFMNPAILTIGLGLDYKPNKQTSINFSPFSYKGTFVPDTAKIDQTKYGLAKDRRSKNEPGASFMITNEYKPFKNVTITNRLQLFTNYINNPLNVDVDWEMILVANLNWFTDVRFNTHLIFDDDTKTPVYDKNKKPVLGNDGIQKKTARIQFKELLGFSFVFRF